MTTQLSRIAQATGYDQSQVQLVKDTIARGASDDELMLFLHLAQRSGLDPFSRQIYLIERRANVNGEWKVSRQPQTAIDGLRLIADRTDRYTPGREPSYEYDGDGRLVKATAYVKKFVRGEWHEIAASAHYDEYVQRKRDGNPNQMWSEKPHIMLAKCAEALAIRRAFPAELSGLYTGDEIRDEGQPIAVVNTATGEIIDRPKQIAAPGKVEEAALPPITDQERAQTVATDPGQFGGIVSEQKAWYTAGGEARLMFRCGTDLVIAAGALAEKWNTLEDGDEVTVGGHWKQHAQKGTYLAPTYIDLVTGDVAPPAEEITEAIPA